MKQEIGKATCPLCSSDKARVGLSDKSKLVYLTCNGCSCQIFARSARSDEAIRARMTGAPAPAPKPADDPPPKPAAKPAPKPAEEPADDWDPYK